MTATTDCLTVDRLTAAFRGLRGDFEWIDSERRPSSADLWESFDHPVADGTIVRFFVHEVLASWRRGANEGWVVRVVRIISDGDRRTRVLNVLTAKTFDRDVAVTMADRLTRLINEVPS